MFKKKTRFAIFKKRRIARFAMHKKRKAAGLQEEEDQVCDF